MTKSRTVHAAFVAIIALVVFGVYANSLAGGFVYDDVFFIKENPLIRSLANIPTMFTTGFWESSSHPTKAYY